MGKALLYLCIVIFISTLNSSCSKRRERPPQIEEQIDISYVKELTPELFIKITILYRRENREWIEKSQSLSSQEQERYLEEMNEAFFTKLGITEEQYIAYGEHNADELDSYVQDHPELMRELMKAESIGGM